LQQSDNALTHLAAAPPKTATEADKAFLLLFRSLALHGVGKAQEAQVCFQQATTSWELAKNPPFTATPRPKTLTWTQYLELQLLVREIGAVVQ